MNIDIFTLCKSALEDAWGQMDIQKAFLRIGLNELPCNWNCTFVARVRFEAQEDGDHEMSFRVEDPDGVTVFSVPNTTVIARMLPDESFGYVTVMSPVKWVIRCYGEYNSILKIDSEEHVSQFHVKPFPPDGR